MKLKKRWWVMLPCVLLTSVALVFCMATGGERYDVVLTDYRVAEDGRGMVLKVSVASSMGYIRRLSVEEEGAAARLTFYSTYGMNSACGAKDQFAIALPEDCTGLYFLRAEGVWEPVLRKDGVDGAWSRPK